MVYSPDMRSICRTPYTYPSLYLVSRYYRDMTGLSNSFNFRKDSTNETKRNHVPVCSTFVEDFRIKCRKIPRLSFYEVVTEIYVRNLTFCYTLVPYLTIYVLYSYGRHNNWETTNEKVSFDPD